MGWQKWWWFREELKGLKNHQNAKPNLKIIITKILVECRTWMNVRNV